MREHTDRRVRKTREALHAAFASLVIAKGYDTLTIQDVLDEADVGRSTFYSHFTSKDALLRSGFDRLRADLDLDGRDDGEPFGFVLDLLDHAKRHAGLYAALLGGGGGAIAQDQMRLIVGALVEREVRRFGGAEDAHRDFAIAFLTGGLLSALELWVQPGRRTSADVFYDSLRSAANSLLRFDAAGRP
jgi:AcrR family transcriptional regulator